MTEQKDLPIDPRVQEAADNYREALRLFGGFKNPKARGEILESLKEAVIVAEAAEQRNTPQKKSVSPN